MIPNKLLALGGEEIGARQTTQRSLILEYLRAQKTHPTAKQVYVGVQERLPGVSLSTVYRTLGWLRDEGEALELNGIDGLAHYDGDISDHGHFTCVRCQKIWDVELDLPQLDHRDFEGKTGFKVREQRFDLYGNCDSCGNKEDE